MTLKISILALALAKGSFRFVGSDPMGRFRITEHFLGHSLRPFG
jgi:hypothetical protein